MDKSVPSGWGHVSVLSCFPHPVGRDVTVAVVTPLGVSLGNSDAPSPLQTDTQVEWTMEVLCYGLTLPLDGDTIRVCVDVYTDWLLALVPPRSSAPPPIIREPNKYVQRILRHLLNLFLLRSDQSSPVYLSLCHQVLCAVQCVAREGADMSRDTWEALLHFLLRVNHTILAPPTTAGVVSQQLSHLSVAVLMEVWLLACWRCFPPRSLWQTCRQMLSSRRHRPAVVDQWNRVVAALTSRLLLLNFGPTFPSFTVPQDDAALVPAHLEDQCLPQTWFRFLHLLSNPVDLTRPVVVSSDPVVQEEALRGEDAKLPQVFLTAMRGVSMLVDAFLGVTVVSREATDLQPTSGATPRTNFRDRLPSLGIAVTRSPFRDRLPPYGVSRPRSGSAPPTPVNIMTMPSNSPATFSTSSNSRPKSANVSKGTNKTSVMFSTPPPWKSLSPPPSSSLCPSPRPSPSALRCNMDSLLHLFGTWLFDAALISRDSRLSERWALGQAEACGALCRIFACKKTAEDILSVYLSRFYMVLLQVLQGSEEASPPVLASVLLNSSRLFSCNLKGVNLLLPSFLTALERILLERELLRFKNFVSVVDLRRASILVLLTLLPLPLQFGSAPVQVLEDGSVSIDDATENSFISLWPRLQGVVIGSLQVETDGTNIQLTLATMWNLLQDLALFEAEAELQPSGCSRIWRTQGTSATRRSGAVAVPSDAMVASVTWVQFVRLLTQRLTSQWRNDSAVCLSVLEVLGGLAKVAVHVEEVERKRAVSSLCCYIVFQCSRPPPLHSRDLHSVIVAAFSCINTWLTHHPTLLDHQDCLLEVLEIVELGISGTKSKQEEDVRCKEEKDLNPASLRVKEAAEATLSCVMQVSGVFTGDKASLDEESLIGSSALTDSRVRKFRYFVADNSVILSLLEEVPEPRQVAPQCPLLTVLIRGPSGRRSWTLQQRLHPRDGQAYTHTFTQRPMTLDQCTETQEDAEKPTVKHSLLCDYTERLPPVRADMSIPGLYDGVPKKVQQQLEHIQALLKRQERVEVWSQLNRQKDVMATCRPPPSSSHFQTARLFLSQLGLLTPDTLKGPGSSGVPAQLLSLDSSLPGFSEDLRRLDILSSRTQDSIFIFYMKAGQKTVAEILRNVESHCSVSSHFMDFLSSLGRPMRVGPQQAGGTSSNNTDFLAVMGESGGSVFDGQTCVLVYREALREMSFIVPSSTHTGWPGRLEEAEPRTPSPQLSPSELRQDSAPQPTSSQGEDTTRYRPTASLVESEVLIVWAENSDDIEGFPLSELLSGTSSSVSNVHIIVIHPLKTGLFRISFHGNSTSKFGLVLPLVNGSVVSKRSLGVLVRETVINCCSRRRLDSDSAPPPHVRRKHVINDIIVRYQSRCSEPAFYSALFQNP